MKRSGKSRSSIPGQKNESELNSTLHLVRFLYGAPYIYTFHSSFFLFLFFFFSFFYHGIPKRTPSSYFLVERKQSALSGRAKRHAENIINLPYEAKIINHLVTTERLKEYGFLSEAVGDICPYYDFYGGRPIKRKAKEIEEVEVQGEEGDSSSSSDGTPYHGYPFSFTGVLYCCFAYLFT